MIQLPGTEQSAPSAVQQAPESIATILPVCDENLSTAVPVRVDNSGIRLSPWVYSPRACLSDDSFEPALSSSEETALPRLLSSCLEQTDAIPLRPPSSQFSLLMKPYDASSLEAAVANWQRVKRSELVHGAGSAEDQAKRFYYEVVLPRVLDKARWRWTEEYRDRPAPDVLISMAGFSPETTVIAYSVLRPKYLLVVTSSNADAGIDRITKFAVGEELGQIPQRRFQWTKCNPTRPHEIYSEVRNLLDKLNILDSDGTPLNAIVDITGGKKAMSAAAALLAWQLSIPLCYVDSTFDEVARRPVIGSEHLIFLDSPVSIFGDEAINTALQVFNSGHYAQSYAQFKNLSERITDSFFARFMRDLSELYRAWCDLETSTMSAAADRVQERLNDPRVHAKFVTLAPDASRALRLQLIFVRRVAEADPLSQLVSFYLLGLHYLGLNRRDFAALLFYRAMEGSLRQRLKDLFPSMAMEDAVDYNLIQAKMGLAPAELLERYKEASAVLADPKRAAELPQQLGYLNSALLLLAVGDPMLARASQEVGYLRRLGSLRNQSVLAHGHKSISDDDSRQLKVAADRLLTALFELSKHHLPGDESLAEACESLRFMRFNVH